MIGLTSMPGHPRPGDPGDPRELVEVGDQRLGRPRVLDLDGDLAPVAPDALVHLADRRRGGRHVVELDELGARPARPELAGEDLVHPVGAHRRAGLLQLGERRAVRRRELLGHRGLHDRQGLAELHRPALELAEHREELLGRAGLQLGGDGLGGTAPDPLPDSEGRAAGVPQGQADELGGPGQRAPGDVGHPAIVADEHKQSGRAFHRRCVTATSSRPISVEIPPSEGSPRRVASTVTVATAAASTAVPGGTAPAPADPAGPPRRAGAAQAGGAPGQHERADDHAPRHRAPRAGAGCRGPATVRPPTTACAPRRRRPPRRARLPGGHRELGPVGRVPPPTHRDPAPPQLGEHLVGERAPAVDHHDTVHRHPQAHRPRPVTPSCRRRRPPAAAPSTGRGRANGPGPRWDRGRSTRDWAWLRPCRGCG